MKYFYIVVFCAGVLDFSSCNPSPPSPENNSVKELSNIVPIHVDDEKLPPAPVPEAPLDFPLPSLYPKVYREFTRILPYQFLEVADVMTNVLATLKKPYEAFAVAVCQKSIVT